MKISYVPLFSIEIRNAFFQDGREQGLVWYIPPSTKQKLANWKLFIREAKNGLNLYIGLLNEEDTIAQLIPEVFKDLVEAGDSLMVALRTKNTDFFNYCELPENSAHDKSLYFPLRSPSESLENLSVSDLVGQADQVPNTLKLLQELESQDFPFELSINSSNGISLFEGSIANKGELGRLFSLPAPGLVEVSVNGNPFGESSYLLIPFQSEFADLAWVELFPGQWEQADLADAQFPVNYFLEFKQNAVFLRFNIIDKQSGSEEWLLDANNKNGSTEEVPVFELKSDVADLDNQVFQSKEEVGLRELYPWEFRLLKKTQATVVGEEGLSEEDLQSIDPEEPQAGDVFISRLPVPNARNLTQDSEGRTCANVYVYV